MRLTEELILLMLDEQSGYLEMVPGWDFSCVIAGAVIADLALEFRIDTDLDSLHLINGDPTGDTMLDPTLKEISKSKGTFSTQYWIEKNTSRSDDIVTITLDRLVEKGILQHETGGFWSLSSSVSRTKTYPTAQGASKEEAKSRILNVILNDIIPDPRDVILICLMHTCGGFKLILSEEDYQEKIERIEMLASMDLVGQSISKAVMQSTIKPKTKQVIQTKPIPKMKVSDILQISDFRRGDIPKAICQIHDKYGPVVEVPFKLRGQRLLLLSGPDVNQWVQKKGRFYLRSKDFIKDFEAEYGASRTMSGMDGAEHYRLRKSLQKAYSRAGLSCRLPEVVHLCRKSLSRWEQGSVIGATMACRNHICSQVSNLLFGVDGGDDIDDIIAYGQRALNIRVLRMLPEFLLSTPRMNRAKNAIQQLVKSIHASHTPAQREGKPQDLADAILELHRSDPQFLPETDTTFPFVATMVASIYPGSGLAFALYSMINHPDLYDKVREEADALFGNGRMPTAEDFSPASIDVTHRIFLETERMYPAIPWQLRAVMNRCTIDKYEIPVKTYLLICQTATHYMDSVFKNPTEFDIDRYQKGRQEHLGPSAYTPFGLGTHACLGHRFVELQMVVNLMLFAYHLKLEVKPDDYELRINPFPESAPTKKMKFRVAEIRNPVNLH